MEDYYIDLILEKCIYYKNSKKLFISYNNFNQSFVDKLLIKLKDYKINDIYLDVKDPFYEHKLLQEMSLEEIKDSHFFDDTVLNEYALKKSAFLFLSSPVPGLMNDIDDDKLELIQKIKSTTKKDFVKMELNNQISWSIVPVYNPYWEESIGINNLEKTLYNVCNVNKNVIDNWNNRIKRQKDIVTKLNNLNLDGLKYENKLGTKLSVGLPKDYHFECVGDNPFLENLPSYEVFVSPDRLKTNGKVVASKPLYHNGGVVEDFSLEFEDGKVINYEAKKGKRILESIINFDDGSSFLGECALVEKDSPLAKTNIVFKNTLLDENASCHLALGCGFGKGNKKTLLKQGINYSDIHVDFMMGTDDLTVWGIKNNGEIIIMKNGKFVM